MMHRLSTALLTTAIVLTVAAPEAKALHPAPFPHRHVEEAAPRPAEARPRREPVTPRYLPTIYAGIGISALGVLPKEGDPSYLGNGIDGGAGFELFVGWRINPWVAVDLEWFTTFHGTNFAAAGSSNATLSGLNGLVRLYLLDPSEFEPYAAIGLGLAFADESPGGSPLTGPAFSAGIGGDLKLNDVLTLGAKLMYRGAFFDNRQSHLAGAPQDTAFLSMVSLSGHIRLNF